MLRHLTLVELVGQNVAKLSTQHKRQRISQTRFSRGHIHRLAGEARNDSEAQSRYLS